MTMRNAVAVIRGCFGLLVLIAISVQLSIHVRLQYTVANFFSYYTNLSNLLAAGVFVAGAIRHFRGAQPSAFGEQLRFMAAINMVIVGIVFSILLRNVDLGSLLPWINTLLHYVMPVIALLDWIIAPPQIKLSARHLSRVLVFPIVYLAYTLIRGSKNNWYPYPFLNPANVGGYGIVGLYALAITVVFVLAGFALLTIGNRRARLQSRWFASLPF